MTWVIDDHGIGWQAIADTSTVQNHKLGTIVRAHDPDYGQGEFIYLLGVGSTAVGSIVTYDGAGHQTALATSAVAIPATPLAVAMSANVASQYGWYQISGFATVKKANDVSFGDGAALAASSGFGVAAATGNAIQSAIVVAVASAKSDVTSVTVAIDRPSDPSDVS